MEQYIMKGGNPLVGEVTVSGAKNAALGILTAAIMTDEDGLTLNQVLYFIDQGCPVVAFTGEGQYVLLIGFDQFNVTLYNPESGESWKMGLNDASEYFQNLQNDFICGLFAG